MWRVIKEMEIACRDCLGTLKVSVLTEIVWRSLTEFNSIFRHFHCHLAGEFPRLTIVFTFLKSAQSQQSKWLALCMLDYIEIYSSTKNRRKRSSSQCWFKAYRELTVSFWVSILNWKFVFPHALLKFMSMEARENYNLFINIVVVNFIT